MDLEKEFESLLGRVNAILKGVLPEIQDPKVRQAVQEAEKLSRIKRYGVMEDAAAFYFACERAQQRSLEDGEPFIVADNGRQMVIMAKARFLKDKPLGLTEEDVVYESRRKS